MITTTTFSLTGLDVYLNAKSCAERQVRDGAVDGFVVSHAMIALGTSHLETTVSADVYIDDVGRKCYFIYDKSSEWEQFVKSYYFHGAILGNIDTTVFLY